MNRTLQRMPLAAQLNCSSIAVLAVRTVIVCVLTTHNPATQSCYSHIPQQKWSMTVEQVRQVQNTVPHMHVKGQKQCLLNPHASEVINSSSWSC
jgi:hypothetical protein